MTRPERRWKHRRRTPGSIVTIVLIIGTLLWMGGAQPSAHASGSGPYNASSVIGQHDGFGGPEYGTDHVEGQGGMQNPIDVAVSRQHNMLFVADDNNNRVLVYRRNPTTFEVGSQPFAVLGQPDFHTTSTGTSATKMYWPVGVTVDEVRGLLFVAEYGNSRISIWDINTVTTGEAAINVLGQTNFTNRSLTYGASGMNYPYGVSYDASRKYLFVPDPGLDRVTVFDLDTIADNEAAVYVLGQPDMTTYSTGGTSQKTNGPHATVVSGNRLFVADSSNNRVLVFDIASITSGEAAVNVLGQANMTSTTAAVSQTRMDGPRGITFDPARNWLIVADSNSDRVIIFDASSITDGQAALYMLGQSSWTAGSSELSQNGFGQPFGIDHDPDSGRLYVAEYNYHRILVFNGNVTANDPLAVDEIGHELSDGSPDFASSTMNGGGVTSWGLDGPTASAIDTVNHRLFVVDSDNHRVLVHTLNSSNRMIDRQADFVLGQTNFTNSSSAVTQSQFNFPTGVAYHPGQNYLYVADSLNNRVMVFNVATISNGQNAIAAIGQANFTTATASTAQNRMNGPYGVSLDTTNNRMFVGESGAHRLTIWNVGTPTTGQNAAFVLGQTTFSATTSGVTQAKFNAPSTSAYYATANQLYVTDEQNERVLIFDVTPGTIVDGENAVNVLGQTSYTNSSGGTSDSQFATGLRGLAVDTASSRLFVSDKANHRVLVFDIASITNGEAATRVFGQEDFTTGTSGLSRSKLEAPGGVMFDPTNELIYVGDTDNNRYLVFDVDTQITTGALPDASTSTPYTGQMAATNPNGTHTYAVTSGALPPGISLSSAGTFSGTASGTGTYNFTVTASTSPFGHGTLTGSKAFSITIPNAAPNAPTNLAQTKTDTTPIPATTLYNFDAGVQGWGKDPDNPNLSIAQQGSVVRTGAGALRATLTNGSNYAWVNDQQWVPRNLSSGGSTLSTWVYMPGGTTGTGWRSQITVYDSSYQAHSGPFTDLVLGSWTLITYTVSPELLSDMTAIAVYTHAPPNNATGTNNIYIDDVQQGSGIWTNETTVRFTASVSDQDSSDTVQLCIEAQPIGTAFTNTENSCGTGVSYSGTPLAAIHSIGSLVNATQYHWQARTKDSGGLYSSWVAFGGNKDTVTASPDFAIDTSAPTTGTVRDGAAQGVDSSLNDGSLNTLSGNWSGFADAASGVVRYEYSIGTTAGGTQIATWTPTSLTVVTRAGLSLRTGVAYYFNVRAVDALGATSAVISSNGQTVAPTLQFSVSSQSIAFDAANSGNGYAPATKSLNITTSTNAYSGYVVRQYNQSLMTSGSNTIPAYAGTYASPSAWAGSGFGYTTSDTAIQAAGNPFQGATRYAGLTTTPPGEIVADHTSAVTGTPITNQSFTLTYKLVGTSTTPAGQYSTTIRLGATALY